MLPLPWLLARYCPTETSVSGKQKDIARDAKRFTSRLKRKYAPEITIDAKGFKKCVVSLVGRGLPPSSAGRPSEAANTLAAELLRKGVP